MWTILEERSLGVEVLFLNVMACGALIFLQHLAAVFFLIPGFMIKILE